MRVLITNVYSYKNKGDAAIVFAMINEVKRVFEDADIVIQTTDPLNDKGKYGVPVSGTILWILLSSVRDKPMITRIVVLMKGFVGLVTFLMIFRLLRLKPYFLLSIELRNFVDEDMRADIVIGCGGVYLNTPNSSVQQTILLMVTCLNILTAKYCNKIVCLFSQSVGPIYSELQNKILRFTLNRVDLVEAREAISLKLLKQLNPRAAVVATADAAFLLGGNAQFPSKEVKLRPRRKHIGITVRKWFDRAEDYEEYVRAVAKTIDYLIEEHNAEVFYVPQVIAENFDDDDRTAARKVWEHVHNQDFFTVIEADLHPFEVIGICSKMDIFIGTRMHSNIFALISYVPVVAIEYEHKTRGIMRSLGLEDLTIDIRDTTYESLRQKVDLLLSERTHFRELIQLNLPSQIDQSHKAIETIKVLYESKSANRLNDHA